MRPAALVCVIAALSACGGIVPGGEPLPFRAKLIETDEPRVFSVAVANRGAGVAQVRESVRFQGTAYCLFEFGSSHIDWVIDPATQDWAFRQDGEQLRFQGRCTVR